MATERGPLLHSATPGSPIVVCGHAGSEPLVVTAAVHDHELAVRSPACRASSPVVRDRLG